MLTLGCAELTRGDYERATPLLQEGLRLAQELHDTWSMSLALIYLGRVALQSGGDAAEAAKLFSDALTLAKDRGDKRVAAECLQGLAAVFGTQGESVQSARLFGAGDALLEAIGTTPSSSEVAISDRFLPPVKEALGEERFAEEWAVGRSTAADAAIEQALAAASASGTRPELENRSGAR